VNGSIVCGVDSSEDARAVLSTAAGLADRLGLRLVVAHVVQSPVTAAPSPGMMSRPFQELDIPAQVDGGTRLVDRVLEEAGLEDAERRVVYGFPADRLADLADAEEAELIVVGSRGRGPFKAAFLGSVSNELIGVARTPVLVVTRGAAEAREEQERNAIAST